jgi:glycosyltransferase involved in cell wall biosynthesis
MKIAFIGQKGIPTKSGGVEKHVEEISIRLAKKGHEVFVYARKNYTDEKIKEYKGVKIIRLPSISTKNLDAISHTFFATIHALFKGYDIIHYHSIGPSSLSIVPKIFKRKSLIIATHHCQDYYHQKWGLFAKAYLKMGEYIISKVPDKTIAVSKILSDYIWEKFKKRAINIPNGMSVFPVEKYNKLEKWNLQKKGYILYVGRLIRHKGVHFLIKAFIRLEDKHLTRGKKLVIVGDGFYTDDYVKELKEMAQGRENIIFTGNQNGEYLDQLFSHAYLFVHPSQSEGLSLALLEAMGYGKAILSSDIKENMQVLNDEISSSFKSGDAFDLEKKLVCLINDPVLVKKMGKKGMVKAQNEYSWDNIAEKIEIVYSDMLSKNNIVKNKFKESAYERNF